MQNGAKKQNSEEKKQNGGKLKPNGEKKIGRKKQKALHSPPPKSPSNILLKE